MHCLRVFKELKCKGARFCPTKQPCRVLGTVTHFGDAEKGSGVLERLAQSHRAGGWQKLHGDPGHLLSRPSGASALSEVAGGAGVCLGRKVSWRRPAAPTPVSCSTRRREQRRPRCWPGARFLHALRAISLSCSWSLCLSGLTLLFCCCFSEVELPLKKDGFTSESTTLEALLRGEGVEKKVDAREEESIQEIQVFLGPLREEGTPSSTVDSSARVGPPLKGQAAAHVASWLRYQEAYTFFSDSACFPEAMVPLKSISLPQPPYLCTQNACWGPAGAKNKWSPHPCGANSP